MKPMRLIRFLSMTLLVVAAAACGHDDSWRIEGEIAGKPTMNLRVLYESDKGVQNAITATREGRFSINGVSSRPAVVEIFDNDYRILGRCYIVNGENINMCLDRDNPFDIKAEGNEISERWSGWLRENADALRAADASGRNALIASYIREHPDDPVSTLLLMTDYDSSGANARSAADLWSGLTEKARMPMLTASYAAQLDRVTSAGTARPLAAIPYMSRKGRTELFKPSASRLTLIALSAGRESRDSVARALRRARRLRVPGRFEIMDFSMAKDTVEWRVDTQNDTIDWPEGWIAGGISASSVGHLGLPVLPYFILTDSTGAQLWRGSSAREALSRAMERLAQ